MLFVVAAGIQRNQCKDCTVVALFGNKILAAFVLVKQRCYKVVDRAVGALELRCILTKRRQC